MEVKMKSLLLAKGVWIFCQCDCFGQKSNLTLIWERYICDSGIVLNKVIPPLVTSCKILNISVDFLAALAVRKGWFQTLLLPLSNFNFWGFPLSRVSVVLPSAKNVVNVFFCFVLSPIVQLEFRLRVGLGLPFSRYFYRFFQFKGRGYWDLPAPNISRYLVLKWFSVNNTCNFKTLSIITNIH